MTTASPALSSASPRKYVELTKLRYRVLFFLVMVAVIYSMPFYGNVMDLPVQSHQAIVRAMCAVLSVWIAWASVYMHPTNDDALNPAHLHWTLLRWILAEGLMLAAFGR